MNGVTPSERRLGLAARRLHQEIVMNPPIVLAPRSTAVLLMDFQNGIVSRLPAGAEALAQRAATVLGAARAAGAFVAFVRVGFRAGHPEVNERNLSGAAVKRADLLVMGSPEVAILDAVAPRPTEPTVTKHRAGAFHGTDLDLILRARGVETLVLLGVSTSGVVLSTVRHGADADYRLIVVEDGCMDGDAETHRLLMEKVFPRQAVVTSCEAIIAALREATQGRDEAASGSA